MVYLVGIVHRKDQAIDQLHFAIRPDALVSMAPSTMPETRSARPATAAGTLSATWVIPQSGISRQQLAYRGPLVLRVEDYSRRSIISIRYSYVLADLGLQLAKARLLHILTNLQQEGWAMAPVIRAVQYDTMVDRDQVQTHLRWAIQVQYRSGRALLMPSAGTYSAIILTEIINHRTQRAYYI